MTKEEVFRNFILPMIFHPSIEDIELRNKRKKKELESLENSYKENEKKLEEYKKRVKKG